jgi:hypothetical protein
MSKVAAQASLESDRPCVGLGEDLLGRGGMVRGLSQAILNRSDRESMVFAVQGPWGSGKSSFLNFLGQDLEAKDGVVVCRFDPWWFSTADDLIVRFFHQLQSTLGKTSNDRIKKAASAFGTLAKVMRPAAAMVPGGTEVVLAIEGSADAVSKASSAASEDIWSLRLEVEKLLEAAGVTVVVLIDDLDRLTPPEVKTVFRLVKGISALRGLVHVIAFDYGMVAKCLDDFGGPGYLEKIVQTSIELSPPTQSQLQRALSQGLEPVLGADLESIRWANLFHESISPCLQTFRGVKRLLNACYAVFPIVKDEVLAIDFVAVQVARVFYPDIYQLMLLYTNRAEGQELKPWDSLKPPEVFVKENTPKESLELVERLLGHLFSHATVDLRSVKHNLPAYLRYSPADGVVSNRQWAILRDSLQHGPHELIEFIQANAPDRKMLESALQRVEFLVHEEGAPKEMAREVMTAILESGDLILETGESPGFISFPLEWALNRILLFSLRQFPASDWRALLLDLGALPKTGPVVLGRFTQAAEDPSLLKELLPPESIAQLNKLSRRLRMMVVDKIRRQSRSGDLWERVRTFPFLIAIWQEWGRAGSASHWLRQKVHDDPVGLAELVLRSFGVQKTQGFGDWKARQVREFKAEHLRGLLKLGNWKPATLAKKARHALAADPGDRQRLALQHLLEVIKVVEAQARK